MSLGYVYVSIFYIMNLFFIFNYFNVMRFFMCVANGLKEGYTIRYVDLNDPPRIHYYIVCIVVFDF